MVPKRGRPRTKPVLTNMQRRAGERARAAQRRKSGDTVVEPGDMTDFAREWGWRTGDCGGRVGPRGTAPTTRVNLGAPEWNDGTNSVI